MSCAASAPPHKGRLRHVAADPPASPSYAFDTTRKEGVKGVIVSLSLVFKTCFQIARRLRGNQRRRDTLTPELIGNSSLSARRLPLTCPVQVVGEATSAGGGHARTYVLRGLFILQAKCHKVQYSSQLTQKTGANTCQVKRGK